MLCLLFATGMTTAALAQQTPIFTPGNLVVTVEGCGDSTGGACATVANGTGNGTGNSSNGGYGDNEAAPFTLFQYSVNGVTSATFVNSLVLPQAPSGANLPVSGEYGSSSEGMVQLDGTGRYLTVMGYGIDAASFDNAYHPANPPGNYASCGPGVTDDPYGAAPSGALAQSGSLMTTPAQCYTPIPRVIALIDPYGNINSSTAIYNVFNTNNPRSVYTVDGSTSAYVSGQGTGCDSTGGVFYISSLFATTTSPTAITGNDASGGNNGCPNVSSSQTLSQDTRDVQVYNGTLYISVDSTEGKSFNRSFIGTLGATPVTGLYVPPASDPYATGPTMLTGFGNSGGTGRVKLNTAETNGINANNQYINLSPENYFFASPTVLYVTDSGTPKNTSAENEAPAAYTTCGAGGLQKWVNESGTWTWVYTLYKGLNLVKNANSDSTFTCSTNTSGTTGMLGLAGKVVGGVAYLYATNYNISDLDPTYLYGISDTVSATSNSGTTFTQLAAAPQDSNFKGVSFAPSLPNGSATITSSPSGLTVSTSGTGCAPGTYVTPVTLIWTPGYPCILSAVSPQTVSGTQYVFSQWQDGTTVTTDNVIAPTTSAIYNAAFKTVPTVTWPSATAIIYGQTLASSTLSGGSASVAGMFAFTAPTTAPAAGPYTASVIFTPTDTAQYATVTSTISVTVNKAPLTVTANNTSMPVGGPLPAFTVSYSGFENGDTASSLSGSPSLSTTATTFSVAGIYPISVTQGTLSDTNYAFTFVNGTLSVVQAPAVSLLTTSTVTGSASGGYIATIAVKNTGTGTVTGITLTSATLGPASGTPVPQTLGGTGTLAAGASASFMVSFPGSAGANGAGVAERYSGTWTGGSFSGSIRSVTLP